MLKLSIDEICQKINLTECFEAISAEGAIRVKIEEYTPFYCVALHAGSHLRSDLIENCLLNDQERWYEEDPATDMFISSFPIVLAATDSRYEYDLNRRPEDAVYTEAWGKQVWASPLLKSEINFSLTKHAVFYKVIDCLTAKLESMFNSCLVYDIHSYNYKRIARETPTFNLGTKLLHHARYAKYIQYFKRELAKIELPHHTTIVAENDVFEGRGYFTEHVSGTYKNTLVFPVEIKKVYCDELTGELYPLVINALSNGLKKAIINTSGYFARNLTNLTIKKKYHLLSSELDDQILKIDRQVFAIARSFEILNFVNPINIEQEKKRFFKSKHPVNPDFKYRQLAINPFEFKRRLYSIQVERIRDINIQLLYRDIIRAYADKIDIISSIGTDRFLYNSLRYFGEPNELDVSNAEFLLHCPDLPGENNIEELTAEDVRDYFHEVASLYQFDCKIEISRNTVSKVLVLNNKKTIRIRKDAMFSEKSLKALAEHEVGVHMTTTINSRLQPLHFLWLGLPLNTHTQEGLAILSEYLSGNITMFRLKQLALRVLATKYMLRGYDFKKTYRLLMETHQIDESKAFYMTARVFRGGGFTKDYLYLRGFRDILQLYKSQQNLRNLLIGKTSVQYLPTINELIERKILLPPKHITHSLVHAQPLNPIIQYVIDGIQ